MSKDTLVRRLRTARFNKSGWLFTVQILLLARVINSCSDNFEEASVAESCSVRLCSRQIVTEACSKTRTAYRLGVWHNSLTSSRAKETIGLSLSNLVHTRLATL